MEEIGHPGQSEQGDVAYLTPEQMDLICSHVEEHIGSSEHILHESESDMIHLDVILVEPTPKRNYFTLATMGMSAAPMNAPPELPLHRFAEVVTCLPPDWDFSFLSKEGDDRPDDEEVEKWYWPIRWLKDLARMPFYENVWIGPGHSLSNAEAGDTPEGTGFCGVMVDYASMFGEDFPFLPTGEESGVCFYYMIPLYKEELDFKMKHGPEKLLKKIAGSSSFVIDIHRKNTCGKGFGLFK